MQLLSDIHRLAQLGAAQFEELSDLSTREALALHFISQNRNCSQDSVARALEIGTATAAHVVRRLNSKGLISRRWCPINHRRRILATTERGKEAAKAARLAAARAEIALRAGEPLAALIAGGKP